MAERIGAATWSIQGERITLPVTIGRARMTGAVFAASPSLARGVLAETPVEPLVIGGRCLSVLLAIHYEPWALKSYDEVGVGLLARGPGGRPGLFLVELPVTGAFTCEAGRDFWALPKWLMDADLRFEPARTTVVVRDGGAEVLAAEITHGARRLPVPVRASLPAWSYLDHGAQAGRLLRGKVPMNLTGVRVGKGAASVRLAGGGPHRMADRMQALGMLNRPLLTVTADRLHGPLGTYRQVPHRRTADRTHPGGDPRA